jgi:hypothetical protein
MDSSNTLNFIIKSACIRVSIIEHLRKSISHKYNRYFSLALGDNGLDNGVHFTASRPLTLSFKLFLGNRNGGGWIIPTSGTLRHDAGVANQHVRVDIISPTVSIEDVGSGVLSNIFISEPDTALILEYQQITADLSRFAGQTIRLRFAEVDNQFFLQMGIDDVQICTDDLIQDNPIVLTQPGLQDNRPPTELPIYGE